LRFHNVRDVLIDGLNGDRCHLRCAKRGFAHVPFRERSFRRINRLHQQLVETFSAFRQPHRRQKSHKLRNHRFQRKFTRPDSQVCPVGHGRGIIQATPKTGESRFWPITRSSHTRPRTLGLALVFYFALALAPVA
jgi:hypothetical protein